MLAAGRVPACQAKKPGSACLVPGNAFEGGGPGICKRWVPDKWTIVLSCDQSEFIKIDRKLPAVDLDVPPYGSLAVDQFCQGKKLGSACTVVLTNQGKAETHNGVCRQGFYYARTTSGWEDRTPSEGILCLPAQAQEFDFPFARIRIPWWEKLFQ